MQILKKILVVVLVVASGWFAPSCNKFDLDVNTDPNNPSTTTPQLLLTNIEYSLMDALAGSLNDTQHGFMGMMTFYDDYNVPASQWNFTWNVFYANVLKDIEGLIAAASADPSVGRAENPRYLAIAQLLKAYSYMTLVDLFGDVPYSEATQGDGAAAIKYPKFDKDQDVYNACKKLIADAEANMAKSFAVAVGGDIIYSGDMNKWKALAKTMKLKWAMTTRLVDPAAAKTEVESLVTAGGFISAASGDFQLTFSKTVTPDNRHPWYLGPYTNGEFSYISSQLMVEMVDDGDPRFPFYFRRQNKNVLDPNNPTDKGTIPCTTTPGCTYGYLVLNQAIIDRLFINKGKPFDADAKDFLAGLFGRDRSDPAGVPADGTLRTLPGVYPCGGYYDVKAPARPANNAAPGGGIFPALTHINVDYYKIEAALGMGANVGATPRELFKKAMENHIIKVVNFGVATDVNAVKPTADTTAKYVDLWLARYDAATNDNARLNVVLKQMWFSSWGSAYELWNAYRRTGLPSTLQEPINPARKDPKRMPYPQLELSLNTSAAAYKNTIYDKDPIFWDKN